MFVMTESEMRAEIDGIEESLAFASPGLRIFHEERLAEAKERHQQIRLEVSKEEHNMNQEFPNTHTTFRMGDKVKKIKGSQWKGKVVGWYATALTKEGYAVESDTEIGSVQIYPVSALERA